jgi:hypothetical protein
MGAHPTGIDRVRALNIMRGTMAPERARSVVLGDRLAHCFRDCAAAHSCAGASGDAVEMVCVLADCQGVRDFY